MKPLPPPDGDADDTTPVLRKHVAIVHSSGTLSLLQRKTFNALLLNAFDTLTTAREHSIPIKALSALIGFDSKDHNLLAEAFIAIRNTTLKLNVLGDEVGDLDPELTVTGLLSEGGYKDGLVTYSFGVKAAQAFHNPEVYARISLAIQRKFQSAFALNAHENLIRFRAVGSTGWWDIATFRELVGAKASTYDRFAELKRRVIDVIVKEVSQHSEIRVSCELQRGAGRGAPVKAIRFKIEDQVQKPMFGLPKNAEEALKQTEAYKRLTGVGVGNRLALSACAENEEHALAVARYVEKKSGSGKITNTGAYAASLVRNKVPLDGPEPAGAAGPSGQAPEPDPQKPSRRLVLQYEAERRAKALASLSDAALAEMHTEWAARDPKMAAKPYQRERKGPTSIPDLVFENYVVQKVLGAYTDSDVVAWAVSRKKASV